MQLYRNIVTTELEERLVICISIVSIGIDQKRYINKGYLDGTSVYFYKKKNNRKGAGIINQPK